jgi:hypothetical protein
VVWRIACTVPPPLAEPLPAGLALPEPPPDEPPLAVPPPDEVEALEAPVPAALPPPLRLPPEPPLVPVPGLPLPVPVEELPLPRLSRSVSAFSSAISAASVCCAVFEDAVVGWLQRAAIWLWVCLMAWLAPLPVVEGFGQVVVPFPEPVPVGVVVVVVVAGVVVVAATVLVRSTNSARGAARAVLALRVEPVAGVPLVVVAVAEVADPLEVPPVDPSTVSTLVIRWGPGRNTI